MQALWRQAHQNSRGSSNSSGRIIRSGKNGVSLSILPLPLPVASRNASARLAYSFGVFLKHSRLADAGAGLLNARLGAAYSTFISTEIF